MNPARTSIAVTALVFVLLVGIAKPARSQTETVLYSFKGGADGGVPYGALVLDQQGNLYGTTPAGGAYGYGAVFMVSPGGAETVLYSFKGAPDGKLPIGGLVRDDRGNFYGTTYYGGTYNSGSVFKVNPQGAETVLHSFGGGGGDGGLPYAGLILDAKGNLYGTTFGGGAYNFGTVFVVSPSFGERVLYSFTGGADGSRPYAGLILVQGNLYGTTVEGGAYGWGTVFMVGLGGSEKVLYGFKGGQDGSLPYGGLIQDAQGTFYGTTHAGGTYNCGTVFGVTPGGVEKVLYSFSGGADACSPYSSLIQTAQGNFYGTTSQGGAYTSGTVFRVSPTGAEKLLYSFTGGTDGAVPFASLIQDAQGTFYSTTPYGGDYNLGTVFMLLP